MSLHARTPGWSRNSLPWVAAAVVGVLSLPLLAQAGVRPNPANHKRLIDKPLEGYRYDHARRCLAHPRKGTRALERWLGRVVRGESWGIMRCEKLSRHDYSLHSEGRAIDWRLDARRGKERRAAMRLIRTLLAEDRYGRPHALARRMGVQGLIFNCRSWWSGMSRLGKYGYCYRNNGKRRHGIDPTAAHKDHIHFELNWPGARKSTSFWRSRLAKR